MDRSTQLIGESPAWLTALEHASRVAPLNRSVLVIGERGTGKELVGERLHFLSKRWEGPFVKVNCAAMTESLLDSELFGHERGAFTGATEMRRGRFELADGGTIFLDEIATAGEALQEKLLRVVEYGEFQRVGGSKVLNTNVRIVAATNADLPRLAEAGRFRWDLLDRLSFDVITLPPLRARPGDKSLLADFFARRMAVELAQDFPGFAPSAIAAIETHDWPGNVRELRNFAERLAHRALITAPDDPVQFDPAALDPFASPWRPAGAPEKESINRPQTAPVETPDLWTVPGGFPEAVRLYELRLLDAALARAGGHQGKAAEALGLTYHQLRGLLKKHGYAKAEKQEARGGTPLASP
ncbi:MAG: phage shock protein operon transcriptional activator [Alphaproteobacteria bacterium]|uniref:phage shock protein operon transcriptional activator n=1 Tax=Hyphomonas sp. TaxID=87 RepID=UPI001E187A4E|nr:phage shock protein operon transcriptional activator [Hyphomonas sp.]MBU3920219.1 phage shock protein operon transcriptional activator [Alphaproteobacteria bacterium]MBU4062916.1 phage shock protein operon transcriptional activator [Alphaproteobacteria bacterium]MBU4165448.1 phage shock protein operon transcriptional activator [Alphaproteobacteria bacterium]MBU4568497.1 phage shock protein operon transcriptional activator [Alphaproteobacteria bacterium]